MMMPTAAFTAQCPYTASTCPLLAPFSLDFKSGGTGTAPSPSACASAHSSPAPGTLAAPPDGGTSNANRSHVGYLPDPRASSQQQQQPGYGQPSQVMLGGGGSSSAPVYDEPPPPPPSVPIHIRSNLSAGSADPHSCASGQCATPTTCSNPSAPALPPRSTSYPHPPPSYPSYDAVRPDVGRNLSASSGSHYPSSSESPEYDEVAHRGQPYGPSGATPTGSIMQSPPIEPVHLQRPIFGQPSPGAQQAYQSDLSLPSPSALFSVSSYEPEADGRRLAPYAQPFSHPPTQASYPYPPHPQQSQSQPPLPAYGSYGTCDVEDLLGAGRYEPAVERKPDLRRTTSSEYAALPPPTGAMLAPPAPPATAQPADANGASGEQTAFISKLWHLLTHAEYERYLRWNTAGDAFILLNANEFAIRVLPRFFRHSNVASFIRQLNLYSFSRVSTIRLLDMADASTSTAIIPHTTLPEAEPDGGPDHAHHHHHPHESDSDTGSSHSAEGDAQGAGAGALHPNPTEASIAASGFSHPNFLRGRPDLLKLLKPRGSSKKNVQSKKASMAVGAEKAKKAAGAAAGTGSSRKK